MKAVHFGAGNIGRGFIGETLCKNGFHITFVDINETVIGCLQKRGGYEIELAGEERTRHTITGVDGINSKSDPEAVVKAVAAADLVTTAIGPNVLPFIAGLIARGIEARRREQTGTETGRPLDVIACENMIGGSAFLRTEVEKHVDKETAAFIEHCVGFPNAAVDRIVPAQQHDDPLFVAVEPFREWVIDDSARKAKHITLEDVEYVPDLLPFIERKLFSVNSGHAATAYTGHYYGHAIINEALRDGRVMAQLKDTLAETGSLLIDKWGFDPGKHAAYIEKIIGRFTNPAINDDIPRVARTPIRKLGREERFTRPLLELKKRGLSYEALLSTMAFALAYDNPADTESVRLQEMLKTQPAEAVIKTVTGLEDAELAAALAAAYHQVCHGL
ncbi:MAG: mannitol-1-phosphate 5-dehydrogenase [Spirochaetaceae bacterium]|jgi:mannitol-1-phosphate 5-dehydrogenase|nr:mannitol-1-phosphate 5-dehydrogenase [Spirochaetaceae bacterium]